MSENEIAKDSSYVKITDSFEIRKKLLEISRWAVSPCAALVLHDAIDLLIKQEEANNRQKEDAEELKQAYSDLVSSELKINKTFMDFVNRETFKAVKEFAEKLSSRICDNIEQSMNNAGGDNYFVTDVYTTIDKLVEEWRRKCGGNDDV